MKKWPLVALAALASATIAVSPAAARDRHHSGYNRGHSGININIGGYSRGYRDSYRHRDYSGYYDRGYPGYYDRSYAYYDDRGYLNDRSYRQDRRHHRRGYRRHH